MVIAGSVLLFIIALAPAAFAVILYIFWLMTGELGLSFGITVGLMIAAGKLHEWYRKRNPPPLKEHGLDMERELQ